MHFTRPSDLTPLWIAEMLNPNAIVSSAIQDYGLIITRKLLLLMPALEADHPGWPGCKLLPARAGAGGLDQPQLPGAPGPCPCTRTRTTYVDLLVPATAHQPRRTKWRSETVRPRNRGQGTFPRRPYTAPRWICCSSWNSQRSFTRIKFCLQEK